MEEVWKNIEGYEGLYQISNLGRVKSLQRKVYNYIKPGRILKPRKKENDYLQVYLYKDNKKTNKYVHRLVAEEFLEKQNNKTFVNHKDFNKANNCVKNLEWVTRIENFRHYQHSNKWNETYSKRNKKLTSKTLQRVKDNKKQVIELYRNNKSIKQISNELGLGKDFISDVLHLFEII